MTEMGGSKIKRFLKKRWWIILVLVIVGSCWTLYLTDEEWNEEWDAKTKYAETLTKEEYAELIRDKSPERQAELNAIHSEARDKYLAEEAERAKKDEDERRAKAEKERKKEEERRAKIEKERKESQENPMICDLLSKGCVTREGFVACLTKEKFEEAMRYLRTRETNLIAQMVNNKECMLLKGGTPVIVDDWTFGGLSKFRVKGYRIPFWTNMEALVVEPDVAVLEPKQRISSNEPVTNPDKVAEVEKVPSVGVAKILREKSPDYPYPMARDTECYIPPCYNYSTEVLGSVELSQDDLRCGGRFINENDHQKYIPKVCDERDKSLIRVLLKMQYDMQDVNKRYDCGPEDQLDRKCDLERIVKIVEVSCEADDARHAIDPTQESCRERDPDHDIYMKEVTECGFDSDCMEMQTPRLCSEGIYTKEKCDRIEVLDKMAESEKDVKQTAVLQAELVDKKVEDVPAGVYLDLSYVIIGNPKDFTKGNLTPLVNKLLIDNEGATGFKWYRYPTKIRVFLYQSRDKVETVHSLSDPFIASGVAGRIHRDPPGNDWLDYYVAKAKEVRDYGGYMDEDGPGMDTIETNEFWIGNVLIRWSNVIDAQKSAPNVVEKSEVITEGHMSTVMVTPNAGTVTSPNELKKFVKSFIQATNEGNIDNLMKFYGDNVEFHGKAYTLDMIRKDKNEYYKRWTFVNVRLAGEIKIKDKGNNTAEIAFPAMFMVENPRRDEAITGSAINALLVKRIDNQLRIVLENQRVTERKEYSHNKPSMSPQVRKQPSQTQPKVRDGESEVKAEQEFVDKKERLIEEYVVFLKKPDLVDPDHVASKKSRCSRVDPNGGLEQQAYYEACKRVGFIAGGDAPSNIPLKQTDPLGMPW